MIAKDIEKYAALGFEASSLSSSSWPIEVGISWVEADRVQTWSSLIQPHPNWDLTDWSIQSEGVHQIPMADLQDAPPASRVAKKFLSIASELNLVSDAPAFEHLWLSRLLEAADLGPAPAIEDFNTVCIACYDGIALDLLYEKLERKRVPHRAGPDSARLAIGWLEARSVDVCKNRKN